MRSASADNAPAPGPGPGSGAPAPRAGDPDSRPAGPPPRIPTPTAPSTPPTPPSTPPTAPSTPPTAPSTPPPTSSTPPTPSTPAPAPATALSPTSPTPPTPATPPPPATPSRAPGAPPDQNAQPSAPALTDAELLKQSQAETIEIFDERPDKPFDRDTEVRLTGEQLAARGAVDLGTALSLLPDVSVRDAGRGGFNIDIRGARKGAVSILIDGVLVTDPYYGTFDVSTIPITDIVQIRVSTAPQSPIDGPGGPGGVVEVLTRDAIGPQLVIARLTADTLPSLGVTATARAALADHLALRVSASGQASAQDFATPTTTTVPSGRRSATGAARLEYRDKLTRVVVDAFVDDRHYLSPPSDEDASMALLLIDRETTERVSAKVDRTEGKWQLQAQGWAHHLYRRSLNYADDGLTDATQLEDLTALRTGGMALATRPLGKEVRLAVSAGLDYNSIAVHDLVGNSVKASLTLAELAVDAQYEHETLRLDAAGGVAFPFVYGGGARPWPEGKLTGKWRPRYGSFELDATAARKGRVPSLRERFDPAIGNPALGPELIDHFELRGIEQLTDRLRVELAPFFKHSTGTVRASLDPADLGKLINLGALNYYGVDVIARAKVERRVEVGGAYDFIKVTDDALDRLPHHRAEGWVQVTPDPHLSLLGRVRYFGTSIDQTVHIPGYTLIEATATAPISKRYLAVLRCDDLANVRPETRAGYRSAGRTVFLVLQGSWD
ncbi:MAG: TonB-dependent receptor plug domain-containing protein [Kofleriaceae bacterium]